VGTFQSPTQTNADGTTFYNSSSRRPIDVIGSLQVGGKHELSPKWLLIWDAAVSRSSETKEGYLTDNYTGTGPSFQDPVSGNGIMYAINLNDHHVPNIMPLNGVNFFDLSQYTLTQFDIDNSYSPQINLEGSFAASRTYNWNGHFGTFEFGGKFRNAHKFEDSIDPTYAPAPNTTALTATAFLGTFTDPGYYGVRSRVHSPALRWTTELISAFNSNPSGYSIVQGTTYLASYSNDFDIVERVAAWYGMNTLQFGRVRIQTGLRFEETTENLYAYNVGGGVNCTVGSPGCTAWGTTPPTFTPLSKYNSYLNPLPSAQVKFQLGRIRIFAFRTAEEFHGRILVICHQPSG
jgi:Outer membrane protein beta-barrel family